MAAPTPADAQVILQLYDLRREAEMRKARDFIAGFWPQSADEVMKVAQAMGTQENAWFRQVTTYWEMAAQLALHGAVNETLFVATQGEIFFVFMKFRPYLAELRERLKAPFLGNVESLIERSDGAKQRLRDIEARMKARQQAAK